MSVQWIRDVDTGELYPVQNDFEFEAPAHLETPEYQTVDYDKTRQMTIEQLQNQLTAAQNHIEAIENEKTSDNNSVETVNDVSAEIVSESDFKKDWNDWYPIIILILVCTVVCVVGILVFRDEINEALQNAAEYQTVAEQELEEKQSETDNKNPLTYILPPLFSVLGIKCALKIMRGTLESP